MRIDVSIKMNTMEPKNPPGAIWTVIMNPHFIVKIVGKDNQPQTYQTEVIRLSIPTKPKIVAIGIILGQ
jgi:hypothetical protein